MRIDGLCAAVVCAYGVVRPLKPDYPSVLSDYIYSCSPNQFITNNDSLGVSTKHTTVSLDILVSEHLILSGTILSIPDLKMYEDTTTSLMRFRTSLHFALGPFSP